MRVSCSNGATTAALRARMTSGGATTLGAASGRPELYTSLPAGRVGQPAEVAAMVAFLASPKSSHTSGVVITLDAGISSRSEAG